MDDQFRREARSGAGDIAELRQLLGARLVAYIAEARQTSTVRTWAEGCVDPGPVIRQRLIVALAAARIVTAVHGAAMTQAWFQGLQPELDDCSPARALRELPAPEAAERIMAVQVRSRIAPL